jgi:hypothetical protein
VELHIYTGDDNAVDNATNLARSVESISLQERYEPDPGCRHDTLRLETHVAGEYVSSFIIDGFGPSMYSFYRCETDIFTKFEIIAQVFFEIVSRDFLW